MSTKAYGFYKIPRNKLNKYLKHTKKVIGMTLILRFLRHTELRKIITSKTEWEAHEKYERLKPRIIKETLSIERRFSSDQEQYMDTNAGVNIWLGHNKTIVKPYGFDGIIESEMKQPIYIKDYHYQNQTDKPKNITDKEWAKRRRFYHGEITKIPMIQYKPFNFLQPYDYQEIADLREIYQKHKEESVIKKWKEKNTEKTKNTN